ncbi:segregation/condensation protein A [Chitinispirillales bacterium ANBcel5]|uniref:segregation and condensation protein A n=1 Tax=Cellulosispirillum alkaliphilum TaxID=3039283 RepID=UPI002A507C8D|nr:segregation/condensation protein A [Chitinispirillales bacterium ANBcel5]
MQVKKEYEVHLELFEGPLDLLLYLVHKSEVSITEIQVSVVTTQYLEYLDVMRELNIDIASEYLHMASKLIRLKARELLPESADDEDLGDEDGIFNREQLIAQLLEYKKYKEAANTLKLFESEQIGAYTRGKAEEIESCPETQEVNLGSISIFDLISAFKRVLERPAHQEDEEYRHTVELENVKIDDRIEVILSSLSERDEVRFDELFERSEARKIVLVVTFMAILELVKMREITFRQEECFGTIFVARRKDTEGENGTRQEVSEHNQSTEGEGK